MSTQNFNSAGGKQPNWTVIGVVGGAAAIFLIILLVNSLVTVPSGHRGIIFRPLADGIDTTAIPYQPGFQVVAPWNSIIKYDVRLQSDKSQMDVLSKDGADIKLDLTYIFRPDERKIGTLHESIGKNYASKMVMPEIRSSAREVIGKYQPEELYSSKRDVIQTEIFRLSRKALAKNNIHLDNILIREIKLPDNIAAAIERKLEQEQKSLEYKFKLQRERKEAERKKIEAQGIRKQMQIISSGLSDRFLQYKGIEATEKLTKSDNSKVVIIGGGKDGLPIILGDQ